MGYSEETDSAVMLANPPVGQFVQLVVHGLKFLLSIDNRISGRILMHSGMVA